MPIKNLTDDSIDAKFPRIGKLRKGGERVWNQDKQVYNVGKELPYWRFTSDNKEIEKVFYDIFGKEPRVLTVYLPYATPDDAFPTWCELWSASSLLHRCDGETCTIWLDGDKYSRETKPCPGGHTDDDPTRDGVGRLDVIIPELVKAGYIGFVTMVTTGKWDLVSITSSLRMAYQTGHHDLRGIPFTLSRVEKEISVPGFGERKGKRSRVKKWMVEISPQPAWVQIQLEMSEKQQMNLLGSGSNAEDIVEGEIKKEHPAADKKTASKPAEKEPAELLDEIGNRLWPEQWKTGKNIKKLVAEQCGGDINAMVKRLVGRVKQMSERDKNGALNKSSIAIIRDHVQKTWAGLEATIEPVLALAPHANIEQLLAGIARAAKSKSEKPDLEIKDLVSIVTTMIPEQEEK